MRTELYFWPGRMLVSGKFCLGWMIRKYGNSGQFSALHLQYVPEVLLVRPVLPSLFKRVFAGVGGPVILDGPKRCFGARERPAWCVLSTAHGMSRECW